MIASCGASPLSLLTGGGPNVAANVQAGKENTQQVVANQTDRRISAARDSTVTVTETKNTETVKADKVETVVVNEVPTWIVLLMLVGWLLPSPNEIARWIRGLFKK